MMKYGVAYLTSLVTFFAVDMVWLGMMAKRFYRPTLGDILLPGVNMAPAIVFYILFPIGLVFFAVAPALRAGSISTALMYGAMFGFFTYATYDLTNQATVRNWTTQLTVVDAAWGSVLAAATAAVSYLVAQKLT